MPIVDKLVANAFLSDRSLAFFAFSIAKIRKTAVSISSWLHVPVFTSPLVKIITRR